MSQVLACKLLRISKEMLKAEEQKARSKCKMEAKKKVKQVKLKNLHTHTKGDTKLIKKLFARPRFRV